MLRPMRRVVWWFFLIWPAGALACDRPVCGVDPQELSLARLVDFEDMAGGYGPGRLYRQVIEADGVSFGEHLAGQSRGADGPYDRIDGPATPPLRLGDVPRGALLSITRVGKSSVLNGQGPAGYPKREAEGEGAIAILFLVPWLDRAKVKSYRYRGLMSKVLLGLFAITFIWLGKIGAGPGTDPVETIVGRFLTAFYFLFFLTMPLWTAIDKTKPVPERVTTHD